MASFVSQLKVLKKMLAWFPKLNRKEHIAHMEDFDFIWLQFEK